MISSLTNLQVMKLTKLNQKKYRSIMNKHLLLNKNSIEIALKMKKVELLITTDLNYQTKEQIIYVNEKVMKKITNNKNLNSLVAVVKNNNNQKLIAKKILVLDGIQDPGNLGTIIRTGYALGINDFFIGDKSAELTNQKTLVATSGCEMLANFGFGDVYEFLKENPNPIITTYLDEKNQITTKLNSFNLVVGNEGFGIDTKIKSLAHQNKKIAINFESLNVAIASALILYDIT